MHWRCPHCDVILAIPQDTLTTGSAFSRCYKCSGLAKVTQSKVSVMKLDATETPNGVLTQMPHSPIENTSPLEASKSNTIHLKIKKQSRIRAGTLLTALVAVISGIYLFVEGQALLQTSYASSPTPPTRSTGSAGIVATTPYNQTQQESPSDPAVTVPLAEGDTAGQYQSPYSYNEQYADSAHPGEINTDLPPDAIQTTAKETNREPGSNPDTEMTDQVTESAMAPAATLDGSEGIPLEAPEEEQKTETPF